MKENFEIFDTTFGQIKIYKDKPEVDESKLKKESEKKLEKYAETTVSDDKNFFGLEEENYFDQKIIEEYKIDQELNKSKKTSDEKLQVAPNQIDKANLNFIDEIYFGNMAQKDGFGKQKKFFFLFSKFILKNRQLKKHQQFLFKMNLMNQSVIFVI